MFDEKNPLKTELLIKDIIQSFPYRSKNHSKGVLTDSFVASNGNASFQINGSEYGLNIVLRDRRNLEAYPEGKEFDSIIKTLETLVDVLKKNQE